MLAPRGRLILLLVALVLLYGVLATLFALHSADLVQRKGWEADLVDVYLFSFFYVLLAYFLTALPLLMLVGYHGIEWRHLKAKVERELYMLGLSTRELHSRMAEYEGRNGLQAFVLPMLVNLVLLFLMWHSALFPSGLAGVFDGLDETGEVRISIAILLPIVVIKASVVTWAFFGAYFYGVTVMIRRWMQLDLTVGSVWRFDVRLAVSFVLGMLIMDTLTTLGADTSNTPPGLDALAFLVGIVPDTFLRWIRQQAKRVLGSEVVDGPNAFGPSDLQAKIQGISFWQVDRLAEEGIESVQDLAMKDLPTLLIRTRFDAPLLLSWVDRALLCVKTGEHSELFCHAGIGRASELIVSRDRGRSDAVLRSLADAQAHAREPQDKADRDSPAITPEILDNILVGLEIGPNLPYLRNYWQASGLSLPTPPDPGISTDSTRKTRPAARKPRVSPHFDPPSPKTHGRGR